MRNVCVLAASCALLLAAPASANFGDPVPNLSPAQQTAFNNGTAAFSKIENTDDGIGPIFNEVSCKSCHNNPVGGTQGRLETRFGRTVGGVFDPLANEGGSLRQDHGIGTGPGATVGGQGQPGGVPGTQNNPASSFFGPGHQVATVPPNCDPNFVQRAEVVPADANVVAFRTTIPLFGDGFVDAVPEQELRDLAAFEAFFFPQTAGTLAQVTNPDTGAPAIGRFGWKAQVPTLHAFSGDAYLNEMGVTNPAFPSESCPQGDCSTGFHHPLACNPFPTLNDDGADVNNFTNFMTLLDKPPRGAVGIEEIEGEILFDLIGCTNCHTPTLLTGPSSNPQLSNVFFQPFGDFLLHDMGSTGDGITQNNGTGRLMRTAPLWGVRLRRTAGTGLMHDGLSLSFRDAINRHHSQAEQARLNFFFGLSQDGQNDVIAFLFSL